jgi:ABC-type multidrug transport system fused ATPase/permease subunit
MIVAMEAGRIVEKGTHEQLMIIPNGHYRKLYEELQTGGKTGNPVEVGV